MTVVLAVAASSFVEADESGGAIPSAGHALPMPWGIGAEIYSQRQGYDIISLDVALPGIDLAGVGDLDIENVTDSYHVKIDYWLLPFLNVFALGGQIDGSTKVKLSDADLGLPIVLNDLRIDYSGFMYGGGATLAVGGRSWFGTLTYDITRTDLDVTTSSVQAWVLNPRIGAIFDGAAIWVGAMYQAAEETHEGVFQMPYLGAVPFHVELEQSEPWNYQVGMTAALGEHWQLLVEGGFGDRVSVLAHLEYRFGTP